MALLRSRLVLITVGIGLGMLARLTLGGPNGDQSEPVFDPLPEQVLPDLPIDNRPLSPDQRDGLVPPIDLSGSPTSRGPGTVPGNFDHDDRASFHPHGAQVCATGCALSNHPTDPLSREHFERLLEQFAVEPMDETSPALEELLFYGRQAAALLDRFGDHLLDRRRAAFLRNQLKFSHARVAIRVVDAAGQVRTWIPPTRVPFDRRHVFAMETNRLQPLFTSGTVKRVGLNHLWTRL